MRAAGWGLLALPLAACGGLNEPSYFPAPNAVEVGADNGGGTATPADPFATIELPFRPPNADEAMFQQDESNRLGYAVPYLQVRHEAVSLLYTITNLGDKPAVAHLEIDGASEFATYDVVALRAAAEAARQNNEDTIVVLPLLVSAKTVIDPGAQVTGTLREDDFAEAALDLDALARFAAPPAAVLVNQSQLNPVGLEMMPAEYIAPALFRIRAALVGTGHLRLEFMLRVRDEGNHLLLTGGDPYTPNPMPYVAPVMPRMP